MLLSSISYFILAGITSAQSTSDTSTPPCPLNKVSFFNQTLYHDQNDPTFVGNGTFKQRYQLNTTYLKPGGPILFYQGAESTVMNCVEDLILQDWAEEMGAAVASLEHRFFGESKPAGFDVNDPTLPEWSALTMNNTLMDAVNFMQWIKSTVPYAKDSKVITSGGSYGGTLSTLLRTFYPNVFYGSLSSAPALRSFGPPDKNKDNFEWSKWVTRVYQDESLTAATKIKNAMYNMYDMLNSTQQVDKLARQMNLCDPYPNATEWASIYSEVISIYNSAAQFNFAFPASFPVAFPLQHIINATLAANTTSSVLRYPIQMFLNISDSTCLPWQTLASHIAGTTELSVFGYIRCVILPYTNRDVGPDLLFPPITGAIIPESFCNMFPSASKSFSRLSNDQVRQIYRITDDDLIETQRILFMNGGYDPTTALGSLQNFPLSANPNSTRAVLEYSFGHGEEMSSPTVMTQFYGPDAVPYSVRKVHQIMRDTVLSWVG